jgi:hypothetical protein
MTGVIDAAFGALEWSRAQIASTIPPVFELAVALVTAFMAFS